MRNLRNLLVSLLLFFVAVASLVYAASRLAQTYKDYLNESRISRYLPTDEGLSQEEKTIASSISPAVVSIYGEKETTSLEPRKQSVYLPGLDIALSLPGKTEVKQTQEINAGTGFFVDPEGYIITNRHVVPDEDAKYTAVLSDGRQMEAQVLYRDSKHDIAVVKVAGDNHPALALGDSSALEIGQKILTMGNTFGEQKNLVSAGSVTDLGKDIVAEDEDIRQSLSGLIQTSAQLYPGDSGGPTFDLKGKVVGVNVAVSTGDSRVSFSVPINDAREAITAAIPGR